jgi:hypothetical protein
MLSVERLKEVLSFDKDTGEFRWAKRVARCIRIGELAGYIENAHGGYNLIMIDRVSYGAHRLAWFYVTGEWPDVEIDHKDGNPSNNRFSNLRKATASENIANSKKRRDNTSGFKGVSWDKGAKKWSAKIGVSGRKLHLGLFDTPEAAHAAYLTAAHKHFGEFARVA